MTFWSALKGRARLPVIIGLSAATTGCGLPPELLGLGAGGATGAATANPYIAVATAILVETIATEVENRVDKNTQANRQNAIATAAGPLAQGEKAHWFAEQFADIGSTQGTVQVTRVLETPLASCKEVVFRVRVASASKRGPFLGTICQNREVWQWAGALPAVERWGALQ